MFILWEQWPHQTCWMRSSASKMTHYSNYLAQLADVKQRIPEYRMWTHFKNCKNPAEDALRKMKISENWLIRTVNEKTANKAKGNTVLTLSFSELLASVNGKILPKQGKHNNYPTNSLRPVILIPVMGKILGNWYLSNIKLSHKQ